MLTTSGISLSQAFARIREQTLAISAPLRTEDFVIQSMEDVSPTKWHLAHTTWFFETFVLSRYSPQYKPLRPEYAYLFNSYYVQAGERFARPNRGLLSRPTVDDVLAYRRHVDEHMTSLLATLNDPAAEAVVEIGLNHEQQHQELMVTDIKHVLSINPLYPAYDEHNQPGRSRSVPMEWVAFNPGVVTMGHTGNGFHFDNERPQHRVFLEPYELATRPVTNAEYMAFMEDGAYGNPVLWLSEAWATVAADGWTHPLYWDQIDGQWFEFTTFGRRALDPHALVTHLSWFEADAYARWKGVRLPTEFEWEYAAATYADESGDSPAYPGHFSDSLRFHPVLDPGSPTCGPFHNLFGSAWEWTSSPYTPYPGYRAAPGALGEYNGKFMYNQHVLRGGSVATPPDHIRPTYRNFFPGHARWQFTTIRLAKSIS